MPKAVIFDIDGTLVGTSKEYILRTVSRTAEKLGRKIDKEEIIEFWFSAERDNIVKKWGFDPKKF